MEDVHYFKDLFESIHYYRKIVLLMFLFKNDTDLLKEFGLCDDFLRKLYNGCKQVANDEIDDYFSH